MTKLEQFVDFASKLDEKTLGVIEVQLDSIMKMHDDDVVLSEAQEREVLAILADTNRKFADPARVNAIFGKPV